MGIAKYDVKKFTGNNDFKLWWSKVVALIVESGLLETLDGESKNNTTMIEKDKKTLLENVHSAIVLSLGDKVCRLV